MSTTQTLPTSSEQVTPFSQLSVAQIAALPVDQLHEALTNLLGLQAMVKAVLERMNAALEQRYAQQAQAARQASGRDFGVCHFNDGELRVTVELPKRVVWDQAQLSAIAARIGANGDKVTDYIDIDYSISESRFTNWPPALKEQFVKARTVKPGKANYRLASTQNVQEAQP